MSWWKWLLLCPAMAAALSIDATPSLGNGNRSESRDRKLLLFVAVYTRPTSTAQQALVRGTWMSSWRTRPGGPVSVRFAVGSPPPGSQEAAVLQQEQLKHGDFLVLPVAEGYSGLPNKTSALLRWFARDPPAHFLLKADDDSFVRLEALMSLLPGIRGTSRASLPYVYLGHFYDRPGIFREGRWAEDRQSWPEQRYPKYADGSGYVLSAALVQDIVGAPLASNLAATLHNEDVSVGRWVRDLEANASRKVQFIAIPDHGTYRDAAAKLAPCSAGVVIARDVEASRMICMWRRTLRGCRDICCEDAASRSLLAGRLISC